MSRTGNGRGQRLSLFPASRKKGGNEIKGRKTGYMIRAPTVWAHHSGRSRTLTTEYRRAAEFTQRGDTAFIQGGFFMRRRPFADRLLSACRTAAQRQKGFIMAFFNSAVGVLQTLVIALGAGLGIWGVINLMEGYGNDNPGAKSQGMKQLMAGGGVALIGMTLVPLLTGLFG
jgi:uncharacterized protein YneF (UPF0154 family)